MSLDDLPGTLILPKRDQERDRWLRDYGFHDTASQTGEGTQPFIEGSTMADFVMPLYADVGTLGDAMDPTKIGGALLKTQAEADGVFKPQAVGGSGSLLGETSAGGSMIFAGDECTAQSLRFQCVQTRLYFTGDQIPIQGIDTGPNTNLRAGTVVTWTSPRPGCVQDNVVFEQVDLTGLTGGRNEATDEEYRQLWIEEKQNRAASGNDAEVQQVAEKAAGVVVQKAFTYPCILGPCTTAVAFTLKPDNSGSSRIPNPTQIASVIAAVMGQMPADEGIFPVTLIAQNTDLCINVSWADNAAGWSDFVIWPPYKPSTTQAVVVQSSTDAFNFILKTANGDYSGMPSPVPGQNLGFYDQTNAVFCRKRILTVTGTGPWTIVCDTTNSVSDSSYIPVASTRAMPWSDSLQDLVVELQGYFQGFGPGEQVTSFFDQGKRQRRQPESQKNYPSVVTNKGLELAFDGVDAVFDASVNEPTLPYRTNVGTPGVTSYLIELAQISAFPLT